MIARTKALRQSILQRSRPRFWLYTAGPYLLGRIAPLTPYLHAPQGGITISNGAGVIGLVWFGYFLIIANIWIYGINDIHDTDTDTHNTKKGTYESTALTTHGRITYLTIIASVMTASIACIWLTARLAPTIPPRPLILTLGIFLVISHQYSAPPIRAKRLPFVDGIFNILYIIPAICGRLVAGGSIDQIARSPIIAGRLRCMAMHAYSAIPDIAADRRAGLTTTAVLLQKNNTLRYCITCYSIASVLGYGSIGRWSIGISALYIICMRISMRHTDTFMLYRRFPWINAGVGFVLFWVVILN